MVCSFARGAGLPKGNGINALLAVASHGGKGAAYAKGFGGPKPFMPNAFGRPKAHTSNLSPELNPLIMEAAINLSIEVGINQLLLCKH